MSVSGHGRASKRLPANSSNFARIERTSDLPFALIGLQLMVLVSASNDKTQSRLNDNRYFDALKLDMKSQMSLLVGVTIIILCNSFLVFHCLQPH